jgi:hypothetical protein
MPRLVARTRFLGIPVANGKNKAEVYKKLTKNGINPNSVRLEKKESK